MVRNKILSVLLLVVAFAGAASGQSLTRVRGKVTDASTGEPLPFVTVAFPGTYVGTSTGLDGMYNLETRMEVSEVVVSSITHEPQSKDVVPGSYNTIDFSLTPVSYDVGKVVIRPGENPAHPILDSVSKYKYKNDPGRKETYQYSTYTKMELDLANTTAFRNRRLQRNFGFVFEHLDTSAVTGRAYLPVMISESSTDFYHRKNPKFSREVVKASRISGVDDYNFAQFTGGLYVDVNLYDNYINIFEVNIPSPLCEHGRMFYEYFLIDSANYDGRKTYLISFRPKNLATPTFAGEVNIDSLDWALRSAKIALAKDINVNWLRNLAIENRNELINDSVWFKKYDKVVADLSVTMNDSSKMFSFMAQRQIDYSDIRVNEEIPPEVLKARTNMVFDESVLVDDEAYWAAIRPYELTEKEHNIYMMVDSVKNVPMFRNIYDLINTIVIGYQKLGPIEVGSLYNLYSFNDLEGSRVQLGVRTNKDFSRKVRLSTYGAYGFKDKKFKGGGGVEYLFNSQPFSKLTVSARHDVLQLSSSSNLMAQGNIISSVFARGDTEKLVTVNQVKVHHEQEWTPGITNTLAAEWRELLPSRFVDFVTPEGARVSNIKSSEVTLGTRLSKDEIVHRKPFHRIHMWSPYPVINLELSAGKVDVLGRNRDYYRTVMNIKYNLNMPPIGRSQFNVTAGKIFGTLPYPLLKIHEGNATYFYDRDAFSCMDFYEFASDMWASVIYEHHFRGFFLGRIPLMKRLQWREVFTTKMLWGSLDDKNNGSRAGHTALLDFPQGMTSVSKPYIEAGFGIENIFRVIRIDAMWRVTHRDVHADRKVDNFAMNFSLHFDF